MSKLINYLKAARAELTKVVWPSRQETIRYTLEVVVISVVVAAFLGGVDWLLGLALELIV